MCWLDLTVTRFGGTVDKVIQKLQALHVILEFAIREVVERWYEEGKLHLFDAVFENFQISIMVVFVFGPEVELMHWHSSRLEIVKKLAIGDSIRTHLHLRIVGIDNFIEPREQLEATEVFCFHFDFTN